MASLHDVGWKQGSLFQAPLPLDAIVVDTSPTSLSSRALVSSQHPILSLLKRLSWFIIQSLAHRLHLTVIFQTPEVVTRRQTTHAHWIVVTQDCDLHRLATNSVEPLAEIRPVFDRENRPDFDHELPELRGIRSRMFMLGDRYYLHAQSGRAMISAAALATLVPSAESRERLWSVRCPPDRSRPVVCQATAVAGWRPLQSYRSDPTLANPELAGRRIRLGERSADPRVTISIGYTT